MYVDKDNIDTKKNILFNPPGKISQIILVEKKKAHLC